MAAGAMAGPALEGDMKEKSLKLTETERVLDQEGMRDPKDLELWGRDGRMVEFGWKLYDHLLDEPGVEERLRKVLADASVPNELKWVLLTCNGEDIDMQVVVSESLEGLRPAAEERAEGHDLTLAFAFSLAKLLDTLRPEKNLVA